MVKQVGFESVDALIDATVPTAIRREPMELGLYNQGFTESGIIAKLK
jgi:glycine cleavage system pyridoxal-binding protein P